MKNFFENVGKFVVFGAIGAVLIAVYLKSEPEPDIDSETIVAEVTKQSETIEKQTVAAETDKPPNKYRQLAAKADELRLKKQEIFDHPESERIDTSLSGMIQGVTMLVIFAGLLFVAKKFEKPTEGRASVKKRSDAYLIGSKSGKLVKDVQEPTGENGELEEWQKIIENDPRPIKDDRSEILDDEDIIAITMKLGYDPATYKLNIVAAQKAKRLWARGDGTETVAKHFSPEEKFSKTMCKACVTIFNKHHREMKSAMATG